MNSSTTKKTAGNQSAVKTMNILEALSKTEQPMRLLDIANSTSMNTSTTLRFLNALIDCGYVYQEHDTQKYMLTLRVVSLADNANIYNRMKAILREVLVELAYTCNESVCLAVNQSKEVLYLDVVDGPSRILKATQRIGHKAPLYCTGVGKLMMLNYSPRELKEITELGMEKLTDNTITSYSDLRIELKTIRNNMWAMDNEECEPGLQCVAAPILDSDGYVIAALSVTGPTGRFTSDRIEDIKNNTLTAAKKAASLLGY
jgi:DNA-binding IclR family transcriptional regulator